MANEIRGIMIPVSKEKKVLLPNAIIAEVVSYDDIKKVDNAPDWLLGNINWRGYDIPLICYETLSTGKNLDGKITGRVAVIKALGDIEKMPYFAMLVEGVPRLQLVTQGDLQVHEMEDEENNAIASRVTIAEDMSEIPNIRYIEHILNVSLHS
ncbi:MAG TPA: chemotaxis protein CheW [Oceanospirillales bacterium]|nr:chemotaxis protein CheW [Oceanospirillales bacterium]